MKFLEKELEDIIWESDKSQLEKRGLSLFGTLYRQKSIGKYGIVDILQIRKAYYSNKHPYLIFNILELKQEKIGVSAFFQAIKYAKGIQSYLKERRFKRYVIQITLIGKDLDMSGSICYIPDLLGVNKNKLNLGRISIIKFLTYEYTLNGLIFNEHQGYRLIEEGFKNER